MRSGPPFPKITIQPRKVFGKEVLTVRRLAGLGTLIILGFMTTQAWGQKSAAQGEGKQVPRLIRFSGTPRQVGVRPARGVAEMSLPLFKEESGGEPLWF